MKRNIIVAGLDEHILKLLKVEKRRKGQNISDLVLEEIAGKSDEEITGIIKDRIGKLKIKGSFLVLVIPRSAVTVRYLQLPSTNPVEVKNMVDIQAVRQIPYTREEMVYDYSILTTTNSGYTNIILVIVHKDVISRYFNIFKKAGYEPQGVELDSLALAGLYGFQKTCKEGNPPGGVCAVIDMDYANTNIVVIQNEKMPIFTRSVSIGAIHLLGKGEQPENKDRIGEWMDEVERSINVHLQETAVKIEKILVIGDTENQLIPAMSQKLGIDVTGLDINSWIEGAFPKGIKEKPFAVGGVNVSISGLLGVAYTWPFGFVNLIPENIRALRIIRQKKRALLVTGLLLAGILIVLGITLNKRWNDRQGYLSVLEQHLKETSPIAQELEIRKERLALIKKQLSVEGTSLDILKELYTIIPEKTSLNVLIYDDTMGVTIKGVAPTMSEVFGLIPKLEKSPLFANVTSRYATQRKIQGQELTDFHIECSVEPR